MKRACNRNQIPFDHIDHEVKKYMANNPCAGDAKSKTGNLLDLFRTPTIRKYTIVMWLNWLFCGLSFFGSNQYVGEIGGDVFLNIVLAASIQIPGILICCWTVEAWGRKSTVIFANVISGIFLISAGKQLIF